MMLVVGLGNPGEKYKNTRHNAGFMTVTRLAEDLKGDWKNEDSTKSLHTQIAGKKIILSLPQTFMNNSGIAVKNMMNKYDLKTEDIIVVYDDIDIPFGETRVRKGGGTGGHNGIESIIKELGTDDFIRLRIGIGQNQNNQDLPNRADFVLENFTLDEDKKLPEIINASTSKLQKLVKFGYEDFISKHNT